MTTRSEDIWICTECSTPQGRHDQWFTGDICEKCNEKMENKIPTAEELCRIEYDDNRPENIFMERSVDMKWAIFMMKQFAKLHVEAALKKASEDVIETIGDVEIKRRGIDKIILESYPLTNIK